MPHPVPPPPGANPQQQQQQPNDYIYRGLQRFLQNAGGGQAMNDPFAQGSNIQGLLSAFLRTMHSVQSRYSRPGGRIGGKKPATTMLAHNPATEVFQPNLEGPSANRTRLQIMGELQHRDRLP